MWCPCPYARTWTRPVMRPAAPYHRLLSFQRSGRGGRCVSGAGTPSRFVGGWGVSSRWRSYVTKRAH
jgi:hypothetical protein